MRILVVSDTHGTIAKVKEVFLKLQKENPVDAVIHCGDYYSDAMEIERQLGIGVYGVHGNCDGAADEIFHSFLDTEIGRILITHGHHEQVNYSMERLYYTALEADCIMACFGHTHRAVFTESNGVYLMNPGSLTKPLDGTTGTFGLIDTNSGFLAGRIYQYDDFMKEGLKSTNSGVKKKVQGGHLRDLLNYSDRF